MKNQTFYKSVVNQEYLGLPVAAILSIILSIILILCISCNEVSKPGSEEPDGVKSANAEQKEEVPYVKVDQLPEFPGGDIELLNFIASNTVYPQTAKEKNIQGKVIVRFCISSKGEVNQASILQGVSPEIDAEAIKVVNALPRFSPGQIGGKPVAVWYMVPINFALK